MKKSFVISLISLIILSMTIGAFGQDPGETDSLAFGNPDGSSIEVFIDNDAAVPIWLKCDENIAFVHLCLATENGFVAERLGSNVYGILQLWDVDGTQPVDGWPEEGLTSQSLMGIADFSLPQPNFINTNGEWLEIGAFIIQTTDNPDAMGETSLLHPGEDPIEGITMMFDEFWSPIVPEMVFSSLDFMVNSPPEIISPVNDAVISINTHFSVSFPVIAIDDDEDVISLDIEFPYDDYEFTEVESYPGYTHFEFSWTPPDDINAVLPLVITAVDIHNIDDQCGAYLDVQPIAVTVTSDTTLPGYPASVDVRLNISGGNSNVGSFNLTFTWDPNALLYQAVDFGQDFADWEYLAPTLNPLGPGSLRLLGMANLVEGNVPPLTQGQYFIGTIYFMSAGDPNLGGQAVDLDMPIGDLSNNILSDSSGYVVFHPQISQGVITFLDLGDILIGDINLNLLPFETGDAITFIDHLVDPVAYPFNLTQHFASDCNQDGIPETIADLIFLLNVINGNPIGGGSQSVADLLLNRDVSSASLRIQSEAPIGGVLIAINHGGVILDNISSPAGLKLHYKDVGDKLTAVVYTDRSDQMINSDFLSFDIIAGDFENISIESFDISDKEGNLLPE